MNYKEMPKIELHLHLDGSIRPSTISEINNIPLDIAKKLLIIDSTTTNLTEYLKKFDIPVEFLKSKKNLIRVCHELKEDLIKDNVIYAEIRFCPLLHTNDTLDVDTIISTVINEFKSDKIKINIILCMMRHFNEIDNILVINKTLQYLSNGVCGIDLAGDEKNYPNEMFKEIFNLINIKKIPFTIHSGEASDYNSVNSAISYGAKRIGHGVRALENDQCINNLIFNNVTLELCPTSNIDTKIYDNYSKHPIKKLIEKGVLTTINTDNMTVSNISLSQEYEKLNFFFNFDDNMFKKCNVNSINASFMNKDEKEKYMNIINSYYKNL